MKPGLPSTPASMLRAGRSTEVHSTAEAVSIAVHSTDGDTTPDEPCLADVLDIPATIGLALSRVGLSQKVACAEMDGLDPSLFSRQLQGRDGAHLSFQRLSLLRLSFWREFMIAMGPAVGMTVASQDAADAAILRLATIAHEIAMVTIQQRGLRRVG